MTEYYAVMGKQVRFFLGIEDSDPVNAEHIASEIARLVLNGVLEGDTR